MCHVFSNLLGLRLISATPSQATIPDCIFGRNLSEGAVVSTRLWSYAQFWNSQDKIGGGREGHDSLCLILPRRGVLNEVFKSMNLWKEIHILLETSTQVMLIKKDMLPLSGQLRYDAKLVIFNDVFLLLLTASMSLPASRLTLMPKVKLVILAISSDSQVSLRNTVGTQVPLCCPTRSCVAARTSIRPIVLALRMRTLPLPLRMLYLTTYINWPCKGTMFRPSPHLRSIGSSFAGIGAPEL